MISFVPIVGFISRHRKKLLKWSGAAIFILLAFFAGWLTRSYVGNALRSSDISPVRQGGYKYITHFYFTILPTT